MPASLIRGKYVVSKVTGPESAEVVHDGAVYQEDGRIVEVGSYQLMKEKYPGAHGIGSSDHLVMPGLINDHDLRKRGYSKLPRHASVGVPSFAEAVADYQALRRQRNGYLLF